MSKGSRSITADQLRVWRDYIETSEALRLRLSQRLQQESSMSPADYRVLLALSEAPGRRLRSSQLAAEAGWERSRLSHHLVRMEKRDLIDREACAEDSRGAEVVLTEAGLDALRKASVPHLHAVHDLFLDALTDEQLRSVDALTTTLRHHLGLSVPGGHQ